MPVEAVLVNSLSFGTAFFNFILGLVVCTLASCFFGQPLEVTDDGARYGCTFFGEFRHGMPYSWSLFSASEMVWIGRLKSD